MEADKKRKYLSAEETAMFCEQVSLVLKSGIPLFDGIEALSENYKDTRYGDKFRQMDANVKETGSLYEAVKAADMFPPYMVNTIRIGERAGTLDTVTEALAQYYMREGQIRSSIRHAITYPLVLIAMMALVIIVLVVNVLPIFTQVFRNLGSEMSGTSTAVMNFGLAAGQTVLIIVGVLIVLAAVILLLLKTRKKATVMRFISKVIPPIGDIRAKTSAARFCSVMSMMLGSGFPLEEALALIPDVLGDDEGREKVAMCQKKMEEGAAFPDAVAECGLFSGIYTRMIRVGYMAGQTDSVMNKLAGVYEEEVDDSIRRLVSLIEPTLVAVLSVIIGAVLLAVMLPLASIMSSL